jgi:acyl carrier protein
MPNLTKEQIKEKISSIIYNSLDVKEPILHDKNIRDVYGADSLDGVEIMMQVEDEFEIEISDPEAAKLHNVNLITDLVEQKLRIKNNIL